MFVNATLSATRPAVGGAAHLTRPAGWKGLLLALLAVMALATQARADAGFQKDYVIVSTNGGNNQYYYTNQSDGTNPSFNGANLGTFVAGNSLVLNGGQAQTFKNSADVSSVRLNYRVYLNTASGSFKPINLPFSSDDYNTNGTQAQTWQQTNAGIQLLLPQMTGGTYTLEVYFDATTTVGDRYDSNSGSNYKATFTVQEPSNAFTPDGQTTTWVSRAVLGLQDTDWLNRYNWSNGVPTTTSDAIIPGHASSDATTVAPQLASPTANYVVRNLTMLNSDYTYRSIIRLGKSSTDASGNTTLTGATLRIYGNFVSPNYGLLASVYDSSQPGVANPSTNSTLVFAGNGTQNITGTNIQVADIRIEGTGDKKYNGTLETLNSLTFASGTTARLITTNASGTPVQDAGTAQVVLDFGSMLKGENNSAYVYGTTKAQGTPALNTTENFGNIGLDITITANSGGSIGIVTVTRIVGFNFSDASPSTSVGIKRIYGVSGGTINTASNTKTVIFHYLDSGNELNSIPEDRLIMFRTANGNDGPFVQINGTLNQDANTYTATGVTTVNTLTLGDRQYPLPVTLTSFAAQRSGSNAVLSWTTATEQNSLGFYIEASADGINFHNLGFVASKNGGNSLTALSYRFTDVSTLR